MKSTILVCAFVALACLCHQAKAVCVIDGVTLTTGTHHHKCNTIHCREDGSIMGLPCGLWHCPEGKQIGYKELDLSKPFPECCARPICAD